MGALAGQQLTGMKALGIAARFNFCKSWSCAQFSVVICVGITSDSRVSLFSLCGWFRELPCSDLPGRWIKLSVPRTLDVYVCFCPDVIYLHPVVVPSAGTTMSIIQDKLGNEFLRSNGSMDSGFGPGMIMFSHLPPVTSFTRLAAHSVVQDLPPADVILKKERDSPDCSMDAQGGRMGCASMGNYVHTMGIKQENLSEQDSCLLVYPGVTGKTSRAAGGASEQQPEPADARPQPGPTALNCRSCSSRLLLLPLSSSQLPSQFGKEPAGSKGRRSNGDGQEGKPRKRRSEAKQSLMLDADGGLSPGSKPHICEHCAASFRSSYHLRRHVLIHTGERPFRCSQCNMSFHSEIPPSATREDPQW
ncbi:hypothetical protein fugu_015172 [Takifugu bimaculatus]|uniref:C2H2-type domain-containing protein n=1 Tax=Takifugu bimaculatus TaxID=433685 RepID=A0A4Z2BZN9_9TELE|nr:hypothetical protein fugu_015172 [Takifugu bimaculatus]